MLKLFPIAFLCFKVQFIYKQNQIFEVCYQLLTEENERKHSGICYIFEFLEYLPCLHLEVGRISLFSIWKYNQTHNNIKAILNSLENLSLPPPPPLSFVFISSFFSSFPLPFYFWVSETQKVDVITYFHSFYLFGFDDFWKPQPWQLWPLKMRFFTSKRLLLINRYYHISLGYCP